MSEREILKAKKCHKRQAEGSPISDEGKRGKQTFHEVRSQKA